MRIKIEVNHPEEKCYIEPEDDYYFPVQKFVESNLKNIMYAIHRQLEFSYSEHIKRNIPQESAYTNAYWDGVFLHISFTKKMSDSYYDVLSEYLPFDHARLKLTLNEVDYYLIYAIDNDTPQIIRDNFLEIERRVQEKSE